MARGDKNTSKDSFDRNVSGDTSSSYRDEPARGGGTTTAPNWSNIAHQDNNGGTNVFGGRHDGYWSENNPYFQQASQTENKQDDDALYAMSVQWEANNASLQDQRAYDEYLRNEQREYDSPLARLQRDREAGINSDIAGGSSAGSAGGSSQPFNSAIREAATPTTQFDNHYANRDFALRSIDTASSVLNSFASLGTSICGAIDNFMTLPYRKRVLGAQEGLANSQAGLADAQASHLKALSPELVKGQELSNMAQGMRNTTLWHSQLDGYMQLVGKIATMFPDMDDTALSEFLEPLYGSSSDAIIRDIGNYKMNPAWQAQYEASVAAMNNNSAYNSAYTKDVLNEYYSLKAQTDIVGGNLELVGKQLQLDTAEYLASNGYAEMQGANTIASAQVDAKTLELQGLKVCRDIEAYVNQLEFLREEYNKTGSRLAELRDVGEMTPEEKAEYDALILYQTTLSTMGTSAMGSLVEVARNEAYRRYMSSTDLVSGGEISDLSQLKGISLFTEYTFGKYVQGNFDADHLKIAMAGAVIDGIKKGTEAGKTFAETLHIPLDKFISLVGAIF